MPPRFHLRCSTLFLAEMEEVWAFKTHAEPMQEEFKPFLVADPKPVEEALCRLRNGDLPVHYTLQARLFGGPRVHEWPVTVTEFHPPTRFVDTSTNALVLHWRHEHRLEPTSEGVRYVDQVEFSPRYRPHKWTAAGIRELFLHRHRRAARHLPALPRATAIATLREMR
jgi:ligand-binding SRPBCC domain-containing protein